MSTNQSVERGFAVLELLDREPEGLGTREVARRLDLHPAIVQRLLKTLLQLGYVEFVAAVKRYRLSYKALFLGHSVAHQDRLLATAATELDKLGRDLECSSYLSVLRDGKAVYLYADQGRGIVSVKVAPGASAFLHTTAVGKALLVGMTDAEIRTLVKHTGLPAETPTSIVDCGALLKDIDAARERGYTLAVEENLPGILSIGAPIRDFSGNVVAAISTALPTPSQLKERIAHVAPHVVRCAEAISRGLGG